MSSSAESASAGSEIPPAFRFSIDEAKLSAADPETRLHVLNNAPVIGRGRWKLDQLRSELTAAVTPGERWGISQEIESIRDGIRSLYEISGPFELKG